MLGHRSEQLRAYPIRKRQQRGMRGADDKIQLAVPQGLIGLGHWKQKIDACVETFGFEKAKLDRRDGGEIRVGNEIRDGDPYHGWVNLMSQPRARIFVCFPCWCEWCVKSCNADLRPECPQRRR